MTILEVLTERIPYSNIRHDSVVIFTIVRGTLPGRPTSGISDDIWDLLQHCWNPIPDKRPSAGVIEKWLRTVASVDGFEVTENEGNLSRCKL